MNTWMWGGTNKFRGWRPWDCETGATLSQHKFGRACDMVFLDLVDGVNWVRDSILTDTDDPIFKYITCVETGVPWLHIDFRNWNKEQDGILVIKRDN